jgi:diadenosine tetraphosphate (Ap4A) HIT family hydrolase
MLPGQPYARRVLFETKLFAAIPSLGPLAFGHSLLCPKAHIHSFAELNRCFDGEFLAAKEELRQSLAWLYDSPVHLFEHGMAEGGSRILCTVDHAHLHFLPLPCQSLAKSIAADDRWVEFSGSLQALRELADGNEYLLYEAPGGGSRILRNGTEMLESQHMRKLFAKGAGREEIWDWRAIPNAALADEAWRHFIHFRHDDPAIAGHGSG